MGPTDFTDNTAFLDHQYVFPLHAPTYLNKFLHCIFITPPFHMVLMLGLTLFLHLKYTKSDMKFTECIT